MNCWNDKVIPAPGGWLDGGMTTESRSVTFVVLVESGF